MCSLQKGVKTPTWFYFTQTPVINDGVNESPYHLKKRMFTPSFRMGIKPSNKLGIYPQMTSSERTV